LPQRLNASLQHNGVPDISQAVDADADVDAVQASHVVTKVSMLLAAK
jgi:hypothetical protein